MAKSKKQRKLKTPAGNSNGPKQANGGVSNFKGKKAAPFKKGGGRRKKT